MVCQSTRTNPALDAKLIVRKGLRFLLPFNYIGINKIVT
jgi:hypothetical protein